MINFQAFQIADAIAFVLYCCFGVYLSNKLSKHGRFYVNFFLILSLIHLIAMVFGLLVTGGQDARNYYQIAYYMNFQTWISSFNQGTSFIHFVTYPLIHLFDLSYCGGYLIYSMVGLSGYFYLMKSVIFLSNKYNLLFGKHIFYILLMPGLHFWNVAIGKDALMFFSIALFFYGVLQNKWTNITIGAVIMGLVRSPVLLLFIVGIAFGNIMMNKNIKRGQKVAIVLFSIVVVYLMLPLIQERLQLESVDVDSISSKVDERLQANQAGGSSINMSNASLPEKIFGFLFRPMFFDASSGFMLYSSLENSIWFLMFSTLIFKLRTVLFRSRYSSIAFSLFISFLIPTVAQGSVLTNLGIATRMKTMYFPLLFILFFLTRSEILKIKLAKGKIPQKRLQQLKKIKLATLGPKKY